MDINVDTKVLYKLYKELNEFRTKINSECVKLEELNNSFEKECSEAGEIKAMLEQLQDILKNADPDLKALAEKAEKYAAFVKQTAGKLNNQ